LARYRAYRKSGLDGIAPYARSGGKVRSPGAELRRAGEASSVIEKVMPSLYKVLLGYPKASAPKLEEAFFWSNYLAHDAPTIILTHRFFMPVGDSYGLVMRQFYVNQGYNNTQAVIAFLPVKRGTLVAYSNRTSTDQVGGFGSSSKRAIGRRVMGAQLEKLYAKLRKAAEK
ncbi:MAG: hypothetical protein V3U03_10745, partial [Myxococcota bacterium]